MPEANDLLRAARERIESPSTPGAPMTREELADLVNEHVYRISNKITAVDANHVGKWERGVVRWPAAHYRAALRDILGADTDAALGFRRPRRGRSEDVDRKTFIKALGGIGAGALVARQAPGQFAHADELVATVAGPIEHYRRMESSVPTPDLTPAVEEHLTLATKVVTGPLRTTRGYAALSEIAGLSAWLAADQCDAATARRRYVESIRHAEAAHNPLLVAYMMASLGHYATESGDPHQGLRLLHRAHSHLKDAPPAARAWLASLLAVTHAALGNRQATLQALSTAERLAERDSIEPRWPWVFAFTTSKAARYQSTALAQLGDLPGARSAYQAATPSLGNHKPQALAQVEHAQILATAGEIEEACQLATNAFEVGRRFGSERILQKVQRFRSTLPTTTRATETLDNALQALYEERL